MVTKRAKQISIFPHQRPESFFLLVLERSQMLVIGMDPIPILVKRKRIHFWARADFLGWFLQWIQFSLMWVQPRPS